MCLVITAIVLLMEMLRNRKRETPKAEKTPAEQPGQSAYLIVAGVAVWTFLYFLVFEKLGFVIATTIYLFALTSYFNYGKWITNGLTSVLFCAGSYFMFQVLGVNLARGILPV